MLLDLLNTPLRLRWVLIFLLGIALLTAIYGIKNYYILLRRPITLEDEIFKRTHSGVYYLLMHRRAVSFFGWPNALAGFLLLFLPLALILPLHLKLIWQKYLAGAGMLAVVVCFLYTFSFLGWLSFMLSVLVFLSFLWSKLGIKNWPIQKKRLTVFSFIIFLLLFLLVISRKDFLGSLTPRLFYYKAAVTLLLKNPWWGYGWDSFVILCRTMTDIRTNLSAYVHNSYLQAWVETGIVGFIGIVLLAVFVFRKATTVIYAREQQRGDLILGAIAWGLMAFLVDNLFNFTILAPNVALFWWAMLAVFCAKLKMARYSERSEESQGVLRSFTSFRMTIIYSFLFVLLLLMFTVLLRISGGYMLYNQAQKVINDYNAKSTLSSCSKAIQKLDKAKALDPWSSYLPTAKGEFHMKLFELTRLKAMLLLARTDYLEAIRRSPYVYYNYFALSKIEEALGDQSQAKLFTQKAKELSPGEFALDNEMFDRSLH
jgi:hypothetical protein